MYRVTRSNPLRGGLEMISQNGAQKRSCTRRSNSKKMSSTLRLRPKGKVLAAAGIALLAAPHAFAADGTWLGSFSGSDFSWANPANWVGGVIPGSNDGLAGNNIDSAIF